MEYRVISSDDHVSESPGVWVDRVPASIKDKVPQIRQVDGISTWHIGDEQVFQAGYCKDEAEIELRKERGGTDRPVAARFGDWDPVERLKDYTLDGTDAGLLYPNFSRFHGDPLGQIKDLNVRLECIRAYNDWVYDEFCATDPERLFAVALMPPWDVEVAMDEAARVAKKGYKSVLFGPALDVFGYTPTWDRYWDPFYATLQDQGLILSFHQPSAATDRSYFQDPNSKFPAYMRTALNICHSHSLIYPTAELLLSGILERFSHLKVFLAEAGASWVPFTIKQADFWWVHNSRWDGNQLRMPPSHYWRRQCYIGFLTDTITPAVLREAGEDNVLWEADYLHGFTTFPNSRYYQEQSMIDITDERQKAKMLAGNFVKLFGLNS